MATGAAGCAAEMDEEVNPLRKFIALYRPVLDEFWRERFLSETQL